MTKIIIGFFALVFALPVLGQTILIIDPGHGYCKHAEHQIRNYNHDNRTDIEIKTNLAVAQKLKKLLNDSTNWEVYLTRETDEWLSLESRVTLAKDFNAKVFLSIHCNAGGGTGTETFWCKDNSVKAMSNEAFAKKVTDKITSICSCANRRTVEDFTYIKGTADHFVHLGVLKKNSAVACLNELGFVDSQADKEKLESDDWRQIFAMAYYQALKEILK